MDVDPNLVVSVSKDVYPPSEDTLLLLKAITVHTGERMIEVGTGSGFIALHAAKEVAVVATDVNPAAVRTAQENARVNRVRPAFIRCDLFRGIRGVFDVIAFNPPYLIEGIGESWAERAWQGGPDGDELILRFLRDAPDHLAPQGRIYMVLPGNRQRALEWLRAHYDLCIVARKPLFFESLLALELSHPR